VRATAALVWAATCDSTEGKAYSAALREAVTVLPAVLRERRRLPDSIERSVRLLEKP
jgi:hypothetical protein